MNKIIFILQREFITRVRKKSFIIMSIIGPLLFAGYFLAIFWFMGKEDTTEKKIAIIDESGAFVNVIPNTEYLKFDYLGNADITQQKKIFPETGYYGILYISKLAIQVPEAVQLFSDRQPNINVITHIENALEKFIKDEKLKTFNIENLDEILAQVKTDINIQTFKIKEGGITEKSNTGISMGISFVGGFLIYIFVLIYGTQVMRGVIEEKTNRIVEVIISSVKPFQLMMGKILGIALVGLAQFILWIVFTVVLVSAIQFAFLPDEVSSIQQMVPQDVMNPEMVQQGTLQESSQLSEIQNIVSQWQNINFAKILGWFLFFFFGGYLLYASFFAAVGSAIDNETDTQQFMFPITIPLILALFVMMNTFQNPESPMAFWFSLIPFTSPIVMMARIPFEVATWELLLSAAILIATFIGTTWLSGKIYRVGILMYGKKANYKELIKWIRYKN